MNTIDIVLGLLFIIAFVVGFGKGLIRALASLIGIVVAVYCAMFFSGFVGDYLISWFDWSAYTISVASFVITFLLVIILFSLLGRILTKVMDFALLGIFNKLLGGTFNVLKYAFLVSVVFMFVNDSENYSILDEEDRQSSFLYVPVESIAPAILPALLKQVEMYEDGDGTMFNEKSSYETEPNEQGL